MNKNSSKIEHCSVMEIDRSTLEEAKSKIHHIPNDIDIRQLSVVDANLINDCWADKSEDSLGQIKYPIEHLPTLGAYGDGKLISWRLLQYN
ncbi:unnamed protein product [Rotaria sp. Silwood1]|nr:unnamed protein product [Rotaria sp. Silwood1]CAF4643082.1 unnamed protein product [Rotaria sp. Silwood1]